MSYSPEVLDLFNSPKHIFNNSMQYNFMGFAGDQSIGELINLYIRVEKNHDIYLSNIIEAKFSAIGSIFLIAAAEKFCTTIENISLEKAIECCNLDNWCLLIPNNRQHSVNFIIQAFYLIIENIMSNK